VDEEENLPISIAITIATYNCPETPIRVENDFAKGVLGKRSPYPTVPIVINEK
jgi:hypothetical protein